MRKLIGILAAVVLLVGCGSEGEQTASPEQPSLGRAVESELPPLLVPANATLAGTEAGVSTYTIEEGIGEQDVVDWYRDNMPPEEDVGSLTYVARQTDLPDGRLVSWGWCDPDSTPVSLSVTSAASIDGGGTLLVVDALDDDYFEVCFDLELEREE